MAECKRAKSRAKFALLFLLGVAMSGRAQSGIGMLAAAPPQPSEIDRPTPGTQKRFVHSPHAAFAVSAGFCVVVAASRAARSILLATRPASAQEEEALPIEADGLEQGTALPAAQMQSLPLAGRDLLNLLPDVPGRSESSEESAVSGAGEAPAMTVEGASLELAFGSPSGGRARGQNASLLGPGGSEAAIRRVQIGSDNLVSTASLRGTAGRMGIETERGGSAVHGQESAFGRRSMWGAQNPLTQWMQEQAPATATTVPVFTPKLYTPGDQEMSLGLGMGGPFPGKKIFWFAALNRLERNAPGVSTVKHPENFFAQPSNDQMQVLSARLGLSSANPVVAGLGPYSAMLQTLDGLLGPAARTSNRWTGFVRIDWAPGKHNRFTLESSGAMADSPGGGLTRASETYGTHSYGSSRADEQWMLGRLETSLKSNLLSVTQISVGRHFLATRPGQPSLFEQSLNVNSWGRPPQITVDSTNGFSIGSLARFGSGGYPDEHLYEAQQQINWIRHGWVIKAGLDLKHNNDATGLLRNQTGTYHYTSVENFASDALAFAHFGLSGQLNPMDQHNCDQTGRVWRDTSGTLHGLGYLPCYAWYSQTMGPSNWWLSTSDWAGYITTQWQPQKTVVLSLSFHWQREQAPPPFALLNNPDLPLTGKTPSLGNDVGPRASFAWGRAEGHWPVLRLGYGMYFGRTSNATFLSALTQTGSPKGDLKFFMRPTDNLNAGGAPPFPYVLSGEPASVVKPGAVEFAPAFRNAEVHQGMVSLEETLPGRIRVDATALVSLGRRLPVTVDANIDLAINPKTITYAIVDGNHSGPLKSAQVTVPFYASWPSLQSATGFGGRLNPNYQQVAEIFSRANSTYEAAVLRVSRTSRAGFSAHARYTFAHAADWNPDETPSLTGPSLFDPVDLRAEYGASDLDVRHSAAASVIWEPRWKLRSEAGRFMGGWMISGIGSFRSGLPFTMRTGGSLAKEFNVAGTAIVGLAPGMNGYGGDSRVVGVGRNTFRYPASWKADARIAKHFNLGPTRQIEFLAESFNLFNRRNVTGLETVGYTIESGGKSGTLPTLNFLTGLKSGQTEFGLPLNINATDFFRPRQIQLGLRMHF